MNLNHLCKETLRSGFRRWRIKKTVCLFRFQNMWPHQSNSPTKTWGRQRHKIFWRQRLCWLVKYVNINFPWSQFLKLVIQGFKTLVVKELFSGTTCFFLCFQRCFRRWSRRYCVNWSLVFPGTDSKLELRLNKIQYLNKDAVNVERKGVLLAADVIEFATLGSLSDDDGDGNENDKKAIGFA